MNPFETLFQILISESIVFFLTLILYLFIRTYKKSNKKIIITDYLCGRDIGIFGDFILWFINLINIIILSIISVWYILF